MILRAALVMRGLSLRDYATADSCYDVRSSGGGAPLGFRCARGAGAPNFLVRSRTLGRS
jgi:hypothetical protein